MDYGWYTLGTQPPGFYGIFVSVLHFIHGGVVMSLLVCYRLNLILTKNAAPSSDVLGTLFALSQFVNCCARSMAPAFVR